MNGLLDVATGATLLSLIPVIYPEDGHMVDQVELFESQDFSPNEFLNQIKLGHPLYLVLQEFGIELTMDYNEEYFFRDVLSICR